MSKNFNPEEITAEKSLWDVFKLTIKINGSKIQYAIIIMVLLFLLLNAYYLESDSNILLKEIRKWATLGFNFSFTTLCFLIAGFTIVATVSKPEMMLKMMMHIDTKTKMPILKANLIPFMKVFIGYLIFAIIYILIIIFGEEKGLLSNMFNKFTCLIVLRDDIIRITYSFIGTSFIYLLLLLKSFIFNIYTVIMTLIRWEYVKSLKKEDN